jgi:hypothetical protein
MASLYRDIIEVVLIRTPNEGKIEHNPVMRAGGGERIACRFWLSEVVDCRKRMDRQYEGGGWAIIWAT